jgi:ABC-type uncharacterized transport system YnjBCD substrate-binding protein
MVDYTEDFRNNSDLAYALVKAEFKKQKLNCTKHLPSGVYSFSFGEFVVGKKSLNAIVQGYSHPASSTASGIAWLISSGELFKGQYTDL